jgi:hypothetical protein
MACHQAGVHTYQDLISETKRVQERAERLTKGLIGIRDSTYLNSVTLRAIAADILDDNE